MAGIHCRAASLTNSSEDLVYSSRGAGIDSDAKDNSFMMDVLVSHLITARFVGVMYDRLHHMVDDKLRPFGWSLSTVTQLITRK